MAKTWILDTDTKGTGAQMVPLDKAVERKSGASEQPRPKRAKQPVDARPVQRRRPKPPVERTVGPLPPGHVRKKTTGELGKLQSVDPKDGTATVRWLRSGTTSSVPLSAITRR
jgi:hypothetical protein